MDVLFFLSLLFHFFNAFISFSSRFLPNFYILLLDPFLILFSLATIVNKSSLFG